MGQKSPHQGAQRLGKLETNPNHGSERVPQGEPSTILVNILLRIHLLSNLTLAISFHSQNLDWILQTASHSTLPLSIKSNQMRYKSFDWTLPNVIEHRIVAFNPKHPQDNQTQYQPNAAHYIKLTKDTIREDGLLPHKQPPWANSNKVWMSQPICSALEIQPYF